jgi:plasmid maintenance system antidote protein VapI
VSVRAPLKLFWFSEAIRLCIAFNTTAKSWLLQQLQYDLAQVELKRKSLQVKKFAAA